MRLRTRLCRLERSRNAPGACPDCGSPLAAVRCVLAIAPREPDTAPLPPRLEPAWGTPWWCGRCGRRFPVPLINVQAGEEDSPVVEQLLRPPPEAVKPVPRRQVNPQSNPGAGHAHP
jgi:hypothetical protein